MSEDLSVQILSQASDSIQKLFDLVTRIDERVKSLQDKQQSHSKQIDNILANYNELKEKIAIIQSSSTTGINADNIELCKDKIVELDKRLSSLEQKSAGMESRWSTIFKFIVQTIWLIVGAWVLYKLGLSPPAVP